MPVKAIIIRPEDSERVVGQMPDNNSLARKYFGNGELKNSTHISAAEIKAEVGNIPVIVRGDTGVVPMHGADVTDIVPMPIEIDDKIRAVDEDELGRATGEGRNQIIDDYLRQHAIMVRNTTNALCCQAHRGKIDYMMKSAEGLTRYQVNYGSVKKIKFAKTLASATYADCVKYLGELKSQCSKFGVGGPGEFIASASVYSRFCELLANAKLESNIKDEYVLVGSHKVYEDNDFYFDFDANGNKATKSLCDTNEICYRALNAGQKLKYLKLDDVVQKNAVPIYQFTEVGDGQRGTKIYTKSKPFPLVNSKGVVWGEFKEQTFAATFSAGSNGTLKATVDGVEIKTGDSVVAGKVIEFTATPSSGYVIDSWAGDSAGGLTDLGDGKVAIEVTEAVKVTVSFKSST